MEQERGFMARASSWTDERIALLKQFWGQKSAAEIAKILGDDVSRNAVIGKAHRLNLSAGKKPANTSINTIRERARSAAKKEKRAPRRVAPRTSRPARELPPEPKSLNLSLLELSDKTCRYPHGDPKERDNFSFCGAPSLPGVPYCAHHAAVAYQASPKREISEPVERERNEDDNDLTTMVRS